MRLSALWFGVLAFALSLFSGVANDTLHAAYPEKPIKIIVPYSAGGISDTLARAAAEGAKRHVPRPVVVENRPGGSATVGTNELVSSKPDGYTLEWGSSSELCSALHILQAPYTMNDFDVLVGAGTMKVAVAVRNESQFKTLKELVEFCVQNPGKLKAGVPGQATVVHLTGELFGMRSGAKMTFVPFQGSGPLIPAILGGHVDVGFLNVPEAMPHKASGQMRVLGVFSEKRSKVMADVPTAKESGYDVVGGASHYLVGPRKLPPDVRSYLIQSFKKAFQDPQFVEVTDRIGYDVEIRDSDEAFETLKAWFKVSSEIYSSLGMKK